MFRWWIARLAFLPVQRMLQSVLGLHQSRGHRRRSNHSSSHQSHSSHSSHNNRAIHVGTHVSKHVKGVIHTHGAHQKRPSNEAMNQVLLQAVPTVAAFAASGLSHELLVHIFFGRATGHQLAFFMLHAAILMAQRAACMVAELLAGGVTAIVTTVGAEASTNSASAPDTLKTQSMLQSGSQVTKRKNGSSTGTAAGDVNGHHLVTGKHVADGHNTGNNGLLSPPNSPSETEADDSRQPKPTCQSGKMGGSALQACLRAFLAAPQAVHVVLWNCVMVATLVVFMYPWFLYSYHRELRVLVPGPIHWAVRDWCRS